MSPDERHMDYRTTIQDIRDHKANQWRISHYGLIAQAAIVALHAQFETISPYGKLALIAVSLAALCAFISLVHEAQTRVAQGRRRHLALLSDPSEDWLQFTEKFRDMAKTAPGNPWETDQRFWVCLYSIHFMAMIMVLLVITS